MHAPPQMHNFAYSDSFVTHPDGQHHALSRGEHDSSGPIGGIIKGDEIGGKGVARWKGEIPRPRRNRKGL